jgi:hypothetical protein
MRRRGVLQVRRLGPCAGTVDKRVNVVPGALTGSQSGPEHGDRKIDGLLSLRGGPGEVATEMALARLPIGVGLNVCLAEAPGVGFTLGTQAVHFTGDDERWKQLGQRMPGASRAPIARLTKAPDGD